MFLNFSNVFESNDRFKLFKIFVPFDRRLELFEKLKALDVGVLNVGQEVSCYINNLEDHRFLMIDVIDHVRKIMDTTRSIPQDSNNPVLAIYNLGILFESTLELNISKFLKEYSKSTSLIIIWDQIANDKGRLHWPTQQDKVFLDFSDIDLKELNYEI